MSRRKLTAEHLILARSELPSGAPTVDPERRRDFIEGPRRKPAKECGPDAPAGVGLHVDTRIASRARYPGGAGGSDTVGFHRALGARGAIAGPAPD
jgi:hypothetical protein